MSNPSDWITDFLTYTEGVISPPLFKLWSAISCIAGAAERRVWTEIGDNLTYPNLYVMLIAPPGVGKYTINTIREFWVEAKSPVTGSHVFKVAPDSMTKASLVDNLAKAKRVHVPKSGHPFEFHSLLVAAEEMSVLLPSWDNEFIGTLNSIYNNPVIPYSESRRHGPVRDISISNPNLNIIAGYQPSQMALTMPEEAWSMGFMSRTIMIYQGTREKVNIFQKRGKAPDLRADLLARLGQLSAKYGMLHWSDDAYATFESWFLEGEQPVPTHSKLTSYNNRRTLHLSKLCIISSLSRGEDDEINLFDFQRAQGWLLQAENLMPDVFRDMVGKSDFHVLEQLHYFVMQIWAKNKQKPVPQDLIFKFLSGAAPSDKVQRLFDLAVKSGLLRQDQVHQYAYHPGVKLGHGVE